MTKAQWWTEEDERRLASLACSYASGPSDLNSCCPQPMGGKACQLNARQYLSSLPRPGASHEAARKAAREELAWCSEFIDSLNPLVGLLGLAISDGDLATAKQRLDRLNEACDHLGEQWTARRRALAASAEAPGSKEPSDG